MINTIRQAEKYLEQFIPSSTKQKFPARLGLKRTERLLDLLNNPQEKTKIIHIAGTSGKGTTAFITSTILIAHGKKTGLHLSPHLEDIRERFLINNKKIDEKIFIKYFKNIIPYVEECTKTFSKPTYFEVLTALAFYIFEKEKVDYAVVETGMGGTFDATNTIKNPGKIAVITRIGHDHTNILGKTLTEIAAQKAGIIQSKNTAIILKQNRTESVFHNRADEQNAKLKIVDTNTVKTTSFTENGTTFKYRNNTFHLGLIGKHQVENTLLALSAVEEILTPDPKITKKALKNISFKGRLDIQKKNGASIVIDGAHNVQKTKSLTYALQQAFPGQKFTVILAIKKGKDAKKILKVLKPLTNQLITTTYFKHHQDLIHIAHDAQSLTNMAKKEGFKKITTTNTPEQALKTFWKSRSNLGLATGSLYYLNEVYKALNNK